MLGPHSHQDLWEESMQRFERQRLLNKKRQPHQRPQRCPCLPERRGVGMFPGSTWGCVPLREATGTRGWFPPGLCAVRRRSAALGALSDEMAPGGPVCLYHPVMTRGRVDAKSPHPWLIGKVIAFLQRPDVQCISNSSPLAKTGNNGLCPRAQLWN